MKFDHAQVLLAAILAAVLVGAVAATLWAHGGAAPARPYPHESPFGTTGLMLAAVPALALWGMSLFYRCSDSIIRRNLVCIDVLLVFWMLDALVKYAAQADALVAATWYLYYVPLTFVPLLVFFCMLRMTAVLRTAQVHLLRRILFPAAGAIALLVLANNVHHLAFEFDPADPLWDVRYTYGPLYWAVFAWVAAFMTAALGGTIVHSRARLRIIVAGVMAVILAFGAYAVLYALRVEALYHTNLALVATLFTVTLVEAGMQLGVLPSFVRVEALFKRLPFDIKLMMPGRGGSLHAAAQTACAAPARPSVLRRLAALWRNGEERARFKVDDAPGALFKAYRTRPGIAVLTESTRELDAEKRALEEQRVQLERSIDLLRQRRAVDERLLRQEREQELFADVEDSLKETTAIIAWLLDTLPAADTPTGLEERVRQFRLVKLLTAYCKRKGSLVLARSSNALFDRERLMIVVNEILVDLRTSGAECAAIVEVDRPLPARTVNTVYDCIFELVRIAFAHPDPSLIILIRSTGGDSVDVRLTLGNDTGALFAEDPAAVELAAKLREARAEFELDGEPGELRVVASLPLAEGAVA